MKSIMKKAIALVIAVAVLIVPMAVSAAVYDEFANPIQLSVGTKNYSVDTSYDYAVFELSPSAVGEYTISVDGGKVGIVGYYWVTTTPSDSVVCEDSVVFKCSSVGQGVLVAAKADKSTIKITVTKKDLVKEQEIPWTIYQNVHTPKAFTFEGNAEALTYVDTFDGIDDSPYMDEDGYFHYGSENGPQLYVDLDDDMMNLVAAIGYGKLAYVGKDGDKIVTKIDYTSAIDAYIKKADAETKLYPLTEDLIQVYKWVGQNNNWYGDDGFVGGNDPDCWMFACYYDAILLDDEEDNNSSEDTGSEDTSSDNISSDGTSSDENSSDSSTPESSDNSSTSSSESTSSATENKQNDQTTSPNTGSGIAFYIIAAVFAAAFASVIALKKRSVQ